MRSLGFIEIVMLAALSACSSSPAPGNGASSRDSKAGQGATGASNASNGRGGSGASASGGSGWDSPITTLPSAAAGSGTGTVVGSRAGNGSTSCARGMQSTMPITPTVWLIVDGSSSMTSMFDSGRSRWQALRSTLMDAGGVVDSLQAAVKFGMVIYSGGSSDPTQCVQLVTVMPALNNLSTLSAQYPSSPLGMGTPTDKALDHVVSDLAVFNGGMLDVNQGPVYVVLATDGQPNDMCDAGAFGGGGGSSPQVEQRVIDITTKGTSMGMNMFVISMAGDDTRLQDHLKNVANATITKTPPYAPATQNDLIAAFQKIVGGATCQVALDGTVMQGQECSGSVMLNSTALRCDDPDGWKLTDPRTVQLTGAACMSFMAVQSLVVANFPCEVFTPD
jgi:hypothetical protein